MISKRRRERRDFPGADIIMKAIEAGASRHLTGILPDGQRPVRDGAILELDGQTVGYISSGGFSLAKQTCCPWLCGQHNQQRRATACCGSRRAKH